MDERGALGGGGGRQPARDRARLAARRARRFGAKLALQWTLALAPVALWCGRSLRLYGDPTGSALKVARLGWGRKPLAEWLDHPIFTPSGFFEFATGLVPTFWRGELAWHRTDLALPAMDALYTVSTLLLLVLALAGLRGREPGRFLAEGLAMVAVAVATGLLARAVARVRVRRDHESDARAGPISCRVA